ncbi:MAG TPA: universal stress protein [Acidimicrobiales bacterium]|nr:universal stress protein [Acidimicrobiales bacterium]
MTAPHNATKIFSTERTVVVGVDGTEQSEYAVGWAVREAKARGAVLRIVGVAATGHDDVPGFIVRDAVQQSSKIVESAVTLATSLEPAVTVRGDVLEGLPADMLATASEVADLLVVGMGGRGALGELVLGSVSERCMRSARCPVVVVRTPPVYGAPAWKARIVVEVDGSEASQKALRWARDEAALVEADVEEVPVGRGLRSAQAMADLLQASADANLLVVTDPGRRVVHHRIGTPLAHHCVHHAGCPVAVLGPAALR